MTSLIVGLWCVGLNLAAWSTLYAIEFLESLLGRIPKRRISKNLKGGVFRYFRDWHTMRWGDPVGMSLIDFSISQYYLRSLDTHLFVFALLISFLAVGLYHWHGVTRVHRPDSGHPAKGRTSVAGYAHLLYFYIQGSVCAWWLLLFLSGDLSQFEMICGGVGVTLYLYSFLCDLRAGSFNLA